MGTSSGLLGYHYRLTWTRNGTREYAPNAVTVTSSATSVTANAGADKTVTSGGTVTLNGSASVTNGSGATTYAWAKVSGSGGSLSSTTVAAPTFTALTVATTRTLTYRLTATNNGVSDTDDVVITVTPVAGSAPGVPTNVSGSSAIDQNGDQTVTVSWEAPTSGGTPTTYRAQFYDSYSTFWVGTTTTTGTSASQFYSTQGIWITRVRVRAENGHGNSNYVEVNLY